ncbi:kinase-like protein [Neolentinus lepideus HHB14362 ss-1]|uniref:Kinase-like protein n=1 Tax=Neolentinus lepideus HHB14362 ss-1 TaxID=1314782 RepID=A0A165Q7E2_9AGAM|nr:kinase-like protein [Neolentinus lepideus HHB14362 ss-1]
MASYSGKAIALKRLRVFHGTAEERIKIRKKFCKEALIWQQLRHRFVLPFLGIDVVTFAPLMCMVSPWMSNGTIIQCLERTDPLDVNLDAILLEIAEGLAYLHDSGLVHGDLRGVNILVDDNWHVQLSDFGLTDIIESTQRSSSRGGSVRWMAPELINPRAFLDEVFRRTTASDIYSFGCVCLELYTLQIPFSYIAHDTTVLLEVINGVRPSIPSVHDCHGRSMSPEMWDLITGCWVDEPGKRPTIQEVALIVQRLIGDTAATTTGI